MKNIWNKLSSLSKYYIVSMMSFFICWLIIYILNFDFVNVLFFMTSFIWHFALLTPGLKEKVVVKKLRFSFISVIVRINYYLQLFVKIDKIKFGPSVVRAISPLFFTLLLVVAGGSGNLLFTIAGSIAFEATHLILKEKSTLNVPDDSEIPPAIPSEESSHE